MIGQHGTARNKCMRISDNPWLGEEREGERVVNMPIKYVGRTTDFKGKTLWEIVGNLKNFGVGRIVVRNIFERYPEPSYLKICKVEALANEVYQKPVQLSFSYVPIQ
jgi:hypothetical protein